MADWDFDALLNDLESVTQRQFRQGSREELLRALLDPKGVNLQDIAKQLHTTYATVRTNCCHLYRDIEQLTGEVRVTLETLAAVLENYGYRKDWVVQHNLPAPNHTTFVGRRQEMDSLLKQLFPEHAVHIITIDGIGGVGKSALVMEAAHRCLKASPDNTQQMPKFKAIIYVSAKQECLEGKIVPTPRADRKFYPCELVREVTQTLGEKPLPSSPLADQLSHVRRLLQEKRTLLIVDNMETIEPEIRDNIIVFLRDLPSNVKVVITSREKMGIAPISLNCLSQAEGLHLIQQQAEEKNLCLSPEQQQQLYQKTGGIPIAIVYCIGQVALCHSLDVVLDRLASYTGDLARFCFQGSVQGLKKQPAYKLLLACAIFPEAPIAKAIAAVSDLSSDPRAVDDGLAQLQRLSLIRQEQGRYKMLDLTREYALTELETLKENAGFAKRSRGRWVQWYKTLVSDYGGEDWENWIEYDKLKAEEDNLIAALNWCRERDRYEDVKDLFLPLNHYVHLYGYWSDHLDWLQWLIEAAARRGDWSTYIRVMINKSWFLTRVHSEQSLMEADEIVREIWNLRHHALPREQADLVESIIRIRIRQQQFQDASRWLDRAERLVVEADFEGQQHVRFFIPVHYHRALVMQKTFCSLKLRKQSPSRTESGSPSVLVCF